jgi:hypothetical protein
MQTPVSCPEWEYKNYPRHDEILADRGKEITAQIKRDGDPLRRATLMKDTRPIHRALFADLSPPGHDYYAGHYRGDQNFPCLETYKVGIQGNPAVGHAPEIVAVSLRQFVERIDVYIKECDLIAPANEQIFPKREKIARTVVLAVALFSVFLEIHPYIKGKWTYITVHAPITCSIWNFSTEMASSSKATRPSVLSIDLAIPKRRSSSADCVCAILYLIDQRFPLCARLRCRPMFSA